MNMDYPMPEALNSITPPYYGNGFVFQGMSYLPWGLFFLMAYDFIVKIGPFFPKFARNRRFIAGPPKATDPSL